MRPIDTCTLAAMLCLSIAALLVGCTNDADNEFDGIPDPRKLGCENFYDRQQSERAVSESTLMCTDYSQHVASYVLGAATNARRSGQLPFNRLDDGSCRSPRIGVEFAVMFPGNDDFTMCRGETEAYLGTIDANAYVIEYVMHTDASDPCWTESCSWRERRLHDAPKTTLP